MQPLRFRFAATALIAALMPLDVFAQGTDPLPLIDQARQHVQAGNLGAAQASLRSALDAVVLKLGARYGATLPPAPPGWAVESYGPERLAEMGGGVAASRDYVAPGGQGRMNARIILDPVAVRAMQPLFAAPTPQQPLPPTVRQVRIGAEPAVLAWDERLRAGEVSVIVGRDVLVQIEGQNLATGEAVVTLMRNWNLAELKRLAGS